MELNPLARKAPELAATQDLRGQLLRLIENSQNQDGGWGFFAGGQSRVEPTCWATRALAASSAARGHVDRAVSFLNAGQLPDGSWPAAPDMPSGSWVTSLACLVLSRCSTERRALAAGIQWLCEDFPRDSNLWQKLLSRFGSKQALVAHNDEYRGWGWTPRTSSWVEPTSWALLALAAAGAHPLGKEIARRRSLAVGLLYDRMCAGGGWNCGNPRVYGVDGEALVLPTCWALLALRNAEEHPHRAASLAWLQKQVPRINSAASLAAARMALTAYGVAPPASPCLSDYSVENVVQQGVHVTAWAAMALDPRFSWYSTSSPCGDGT